MEQKFEYSYPHNERSNNSWNGAARFEVIFGLCLDFSHNMYYSENRLLGRPSPIHPTPLHSTHCMESQTLPKRPNSVIPMSSWAIKGPRSESGI